MTEEVLRTRIGVRTMQTLKPHSSGATRVMVWDTGVKGFGVRVAATGRKTFVVKYEWRGKDQTFTIGELGSPWTPSTARVRAQDILRQVRAGEDPAAPKRDQRSALTVSDLIELWLREGPSSRPTKRRWSWMTDASRLRRHAGPVIGRILAKEVRRRDMEHMQAEIANGTTADVNKRKGRGRVRMKGGPLVAANVVQCVSAMYGWALDQDLVEMNPCIRVKRAKAGRRVRFLSTDETRALIETLDAMQAAGEINAAHLAIFLQIERSKTGLRDPIRLASPALKILQERFERRDQVNPYVFPNQHNGRGAATAVDVRGRR